MVNDILIILFENFGGKKMYILFILKFSLCIIYLFIIVSYFQIPIHSFKYLPISVFFENN